MVPVWNSLYRHLHLTHREVYVESISFLSAILVLLVLDPPRVINFKRQPIDCHNHGRKIYPIALRHSSSHNTIGTGSHTLSHHSQTHLTYQATGKAQSTRQEQEGEYKLADYCTIFCVCARSLSSSVFHLPQYGGIPNFKLKWQSILTLGTIRAIAV